MRATDNILNLFTKSPLFPYQRHSESIDIIAKKDVPLFCLPFAAGGTSTFVDKEIQNYKSPLEYRTYMKMRNMPLMRQVATRYIAENLHHNSTKPLGTELSIMMAERCRDIMDSSYRFQIAPTNAGHNYYIFNEPSMLSYTASYWNTGRGTLVMDQNTIYYRTMTDSKHRIYPICMIAVKRKYLPDLLEIYANLQVTNKGMVSKFYPNPKWFNVYAHDFNKSEIQCMRPYQNKEKVITARVSELNDLGMNIIYTTRHLGQIYTDVNNVDVPPIFDSFDKKKIATYGEQAKKSVLALRDNIVW